MDMSAREVFEAFAHAAHEGDRATGRMLAGDCWSSVRGWFGSGVEEVAVTSSQPADNASDELTGRVKFTYTASQTTDTAGQWTATLERDDPESPWRVCELAPSAHA